MLKEMPASLYMDWRSLYEESPDTGRRIDFGAANIANTFYNMFRGRKGRKGRLKDFLLNFVPQRIKKVAPDLLQKVEVLNRLFGGKDLRKK